MGYGGATWDTAGTLDVGAGNTFDRVDATTDGDLLNDEAWWLLTVDAPYRVELSADGQLFTIYSGADYDTRQFVPTIGGGYSPAAFWAHPGIEYRVLVGVLGPGPHVDTYQVTYARSALSVTDWSDQLRDRDDNVLIISGTDLTLGSLTATNRAPYDERQAFYEKVISYIDAAEENSAPRRRSEYVVQEVLSGSEPILTGGDDCAWTHAAWGDNDHQYWNTTTTDFEEHGPPVCRPTFTGTTDPDNTPVSRALQRLEGALGAPLISGGAEAVESLPSRGVWFRPIRDGLPALGVLTESDIDFIAAGLPADYAGSVWIEYEGDLELTEVWLAGDHPAGRSGDVAKTTLIFGNDAILPPYYEGDGDTVLGTWGDFWQKGLPGTGIVGREYVSIEYQNGDPDWIQYETITGWDDCGDPDYDIPDLAYGMKVVEPPALNTEFVSDVDLAVKAILRAPRFRLVYEPPAVTAVPPRRIFQRSDGATHGARRVFGGGNTVQAGNRTLGNIL